MKKLYYLDESEKERILNLHNKHKGNLLNESEDRIKFNEDVREKCKKYESIKPTKSIKELNTIADGINSNIVASNYASDETEKNIKGFLSQIKTTADFCSLYKIYKTRHSRAGGDLLGLLSYEFFNGENWKNHVKLPILDAIEDYNENIKAPSGQNAPQSKEGTTNFETCLTFNKLKKDATRNAFYFEEGNKQTYYYPNGNWYSVVYNDDNTMKERLPAEKGKFYKFTCDASNKIIPTKDTSTTTQQTNTGGSGTSGQKIAGGYVLPNAFTPEKVSTIKTAVGSTDKSGSLTQDDINKLYAKLSKK